MRRPRGCGGQRSRSRMRRTWTAPRCLRRKPSRAWPSAWSRAMAEFRMPSLGADMEAGVLISWRAKLGDRLERGDIIAEVETDKGIIEVEVFVPGVVTE